MQQEQSLNMNLSQHLMMTMKLQQAIQILQLSAQDLRAEIEKEYLENPALELEYDDGAAGLKSETLQAEDVSALARYLGEDSGQPRYFTDDQEHGMETAAPTDWTLEQELMEQVNFAFSDEKERSIATFIVGSINDSGYLTVSVEVAAAALKIPIEQAAAVLERVQGFEPAGVAARSLAECLRIQARQQGIYEGLVAAVIDRHLDEVADSRIREIAEAEHCHPADVQLAVDIVRKLNPRPGNAYGGPAANYIIPDVLVQKEDGRYRVVLNDNYVPRLHIAAVYRQADTFDADTQKYISQRLHAATWLIHSIEQRRTTIRQVVEEIVRIQRDFLEKGEAYLRPMTMKGIADTIGVHESTVSRAVANKYVELPNGIMALRNFFTANLAKADNGEDFIAGQVKTAIEKLIQAEDAHKPLSDQRICVLLKEQNMDISRRTVMKYREQLGYPSSVKRKRY